MDENERPDWFVGDLDDPAVEAIAHALPPGVRRRSAEAELPEEWVAEDPTPGLLVLHRPILTTLDARRLSRLRSRGEIPTRVILCVGPHARHDDLGRWGSLFDRVIPEATASETIRRHVEPRSTQSPNRSEIRVVSSLHEVRSLLVETCRRVGHEANGYAENSTIPVGGLLVWDVPVLDPTWSERLARRAKSSPVIALLGFADRESVALARRSGAVACLDWPCEPDDLAFVIDRVSSPVWAPIAEAAHHVPPPPTSSRRAGRHEVAEPGRSA